MFVCIAVFRGLPLVTGFLLLPPLSHSMEVISFKTPLSVAGGGGGGGAQSAHAHLKRVFFSGTLACGMTFVSEETTRWVEPG